MSKLGQQLLLRLVRLKLLLIQYPDIIIGSCKTNGYILAIHVANIGDWNQPAMLMAVYTFQIHTRIHDIMKTCLFKYTENFTTIKWNFSDKRIDIFHISAQNIDCRYSLEPPRWGGSNEYQQSIFLSRNKKNNVYPCKPQFYMYYTKVGFKGVKII